MAAGIGKSSGFDRAEVVPLANSRRHSSSLSRSSPAFCGQRAAGSLASRPLSSSTKGAGTFASCSNGGVLLLVVNQHFDHRPVEGQLPGEHLPEDDPETVKVRAAVEIVRARALLGAGVSGRPDET